MTKKQSANSPKKQCEDCSEKQKKLGNIIDAFVKNMFGRVFLFVDL